MSSTVIVESQTCCRVVSGRERARQRVAAFAIAGSLFAAHLNRHHRSCRWQWRRQGSARQSTQQCSQLEARSELLCSTVIVWLVKCCCHRRPSQ